MAKRVEDLKVWQRAQEFWVAVNAIIDGSGFQRDRRLRDQVKDAADSIVSNIAEGFEQPTDRAFAKYLFTSKASTAEVRKRLLMACHHGYITKEEFASRNELGDEVAQDDDRTDQVPDQKRPQRPWTGAGLKTRD